MMPNAKLIHSIGVSQANEFDLLADEEESVDDAVLGGEDPTLLQSVRLDHFISRRFTVNDDFFLILCVESTWVQLLEPIKKCSVRLEDKDLIVDI